MLIDQIYQWSNGFIDRSFGGLVIKVVVAAAAACCSFFHIIMIDESCVENEQRRATLVLPPPNFLAWVATSLMEDNYFCREE
jgi:hypothetical protein